jgi:hypothetical protein
MAKGEKKTVELEKGMSKIEPELELLRKREKVLLDLIERMENDNRKAELQAAWMASEFSSPDDVESDGDGGAGEIHGKILDQVKKMEALYELFDGYKENSSRPLSWVGYLGMAQILRETSDTLCGVIEPLKPLGCDVKLVKIPRGN